MRVVCAVVVMHVFRVVLGHRYDNMVGCNCCPGKWQLLVNIAKCNVVDSFLMKLGFTL